MYQIFQLTVLRVGEGGEVDVVGAKAGNGKLDIIHIEAGANSIKSLQKKFSNKVCDTVKEYFQERLNFSDEVNYQKIYLPGYCNEPIIKRATEIGITVKKLPDFICKDILQTIKDWKQNPPHRPRTRNRDIITLPEGHWLLCLIDSFKYRKLLKCPD